MHGSKIVASLFRVCFTSIDEQGESYPCTQIAMTWNGKRRCPFCTRYASGVYFYRLTAPGINQVKKMLMLK